MLLYPTYMNVLVYETLVTLIHKQLGICFGILKLIITNETFYFFDICIKDELTSV